MSVPQHLPSNVATNLQSALFASFRLTETDPPEKGQMIQKAYIQKLEEGAQATMSLCNAVTGEKKVLRKKKALIHRLVEKQRHEMESYR